MLSSFLCRCCFVGWAVLLTNGLVWSRTPAPCRLVVSGQVISADDPGGLPGAAITLRSIGPDSPPRGITADATGRFRLTDFCPGRYILEISSVGFSTVKQTLIIQSDTTLTPVLLVTERVELAEVEVVEHHSEARQLLQVQAELSGPALNATRGNSLGESLKGITGLNTIQTGPGIAKPVIHGLYSNRIVILNNGIRQEDQQWGSEHAPQIDPFVASRLTVVKGAASIRYGSDALGGVILVEPKSMPTRPGLSAEVNLVGATNGRQGVASALVDGAFGGRLQGLSWRVQGTLHRAGYGQTPHYFLENTSYREANLSGDLHYDRKRWGLEVYYSRFDTRIGLFGGAQVGSLTDLYAALDRPAPLRQPGFSYQLDRPYQAVTHDLLKVQANVRLARIGTVSATLARQENRREEFDYLSFSQATTPELSLKLVTETADLIWEQRTRTTRANGVFSGSAGLNGISQGNVRRYLFLIPNFRSYGAGGFVIERYARDKWTLEGGLRYDYRWLRAYFLDEPTKTVYTKTRDWQNLTGSLGATYALRPDLTLTANLGTAWRAPNVADLYSDGLHQSAVAYERGNPDLVPEQALDGNLVLAYVGKRLSAEIGGYNNLIHNYIYLRPDSVPILRQRGAFPAYSYSQVRATFRGLDATLTYKLTDRLSLTNRTSLLFAYDHTNDGYLVSIPPNRTDNSLRYRLGNTARLSDMYLQVSGLYVARQTRAPAVTARTEAGQTIFTGDFAAPPPAYFLLGAEVGGSVSVGGQRVNIILSGTNLANVAYRDYLNRFRYYADEIGRNITLRINIPLSIN